jgi:diguanylate cyclase
MKNNTVPADIARQTLIQLAKNSLPPTPENYAASYKEIAGSKAIDEPSVNKTLHKVLVDVSKKSPQFEPIERAINTAVKKQNWTELEKQFKQLFSGDSNNNATSDVNWATLIRTLLKQLETSHKGITLSRKKEGLSRVLTNFAKKPEVLAEKVQALMRSWGNDVSSVEAQIASDELSQTQEINPETEKSATTNAPGKRDDSAEKLRDMMVRTLDLALIPMLDNKSEHYKKAENLLQQLRQLNAEQTLEKSAQDLKGILLAIETERDNQQDINESLVNLLKLIAQSMSELIGEDKWLKGQIDIVNDVLNKPMSINNLQNADSSLKELIHKQSSLRPAMQDAKDLLKQMAAIFITRLVEVTESTDEYHHKIESHQTKLSSIDGIDELNSVLQSVLDDTRTIGLTVQRTREEFNDSQTKVNQAEQKIQELTSVLEYINEVANEDYLTGTLNRRGMEEALEREFSRADRHNTDLSIAMMDIDHFKKLNDSLGHSTGDEALAHFAQVIKEVKRTTDVLARYGGEEFIIILPNTMQDDAIKVIERVQRKLTKNFFMHSDERVVITFSAGVAQRISNELPEDVIPRADAALYEAKNSGRNRVIGAPIVESINDNPKPTTASEKTTDETRH